MTCTSGKTDATAAKDACKKEWGSDQTEAADIMKKYNNDDTKKAVEKCKKTAESYQTNKCNDTDADSSCEGLKKDAKSCANENADRKKDMDKVKKTMDRYYYMCKEMNEGKVKTTDTDKAKQATKEEAKTFCKDFTTKADGWNKEAKDKMGMNIKGAKKSFTPRETKNK